MDVLVSYDVATGDPAGRRRLRRVANSCCGFGQRVQKSVFECSLSAMQYEELKHKLLKQIDVGADSLRFYRLQTPKPQFIEHFGVNEPLDFHDPLVI